MRCRILLVFLIFIFVTCSNEKKNTQKEIFTLKALLDNMNNSQINPVTTCEETMDAMELCAASSPDFQFMALTEAIFASILSKNQFINYTDYCREMINGVLFKNQSDSIKECFLKCDKSYWQTRKNLNICNDSLKVMVEGSYNDSGTISCKRNCLMPTNNNP